VTELRRQIARTIEAAGGEVRDDRYVLRPGIFLAGQPEAERPTPTMTAVGNCLGLESGNSQFVTLAESAAVVTYMNPSSRSSGGPEYVKKVLELGHHSIAGQAFVTLGLFGVPLEVIIELLSHGMDTTARLTSSAVKAMDDPLFCVFGPEPERSIRLLEAILQAHRNHGWVPEERPAAREQRNSFWPANRATVLFMGMRLIDWSKLLSKRLPRVGNEAALRYLCGLIAVCLRGVEDYRYVIKSPEEYGWEEDPWR